MKELLICVLSFMVFTIILYMLWEARERRKRDFDAYEKRYKKLSDMISNYQVNDLNYDFLLMQLKNLGNMKYRNMKKTSDLVISFYFQYRVIATKRAQEKMIKQN